MFLRVTTCSLTVLVLEGIWKRILLHFQVPCELQYWDVLSRQFVTYSMFHVSENDSCDLDLPQPLTPGSHRVKPRMSAVWRVEILKPGDLDVDQFIFPM